MVPIQALIVTHFVLMNQFGLINTWLGVILPQLIVPVAVIVYKQFFDSIPHELSRGGAARRRQRIPDLRPHLPAHELGRDDRARHHHLHRCLEQLPLAVPRVELRCQHDRHGRHHPGARELRRAICPQPRGRRAGGAAGRGQPTSCSSAASPKPSCCPPASRAECPPTSSPGPDITMATAKLLADRDFVQADIDRRDVRHLRGAPRPLRLRRHLRARPPDRRRARVPRRRAGADARARRHDRALPGRQLHVGLQLGGRGRAGREPTEEARPCLVLDRAEHLRHQRVHRLVQGRLRRADARRQSRHARPRRGARVPGILQPRPRAATSAELRRSRTATTSRTT